MPAGRLRRLWDMSGRHRRGAASRRGRHRKPPAHQPWAVPAVAAVLVLGGTGTGFGVTAALSSGSQHDVHLPTMTLREAGFAPVRASGHSAAAARHDRTPSAALVVRTMRSVSWVQVRRPSGRVLFSGTLTRGHVLRYAHGPLEVTIGNAGAVRLVRHGKVTARAGRPGEVLRLRVR
jgi:hypothetical protein